MPPPHRVPPAPPARQERLALSAPLEPLDPPAPLVRQERQEPQELPAPLALPAQRALPALPDPRRQSFMRNNSDSFSASFAEFLLVVLYVLCNTAVLVCIIKFDFDALILMDIDCVDKLHQQAAG